MKVRRSIIALVLMGLFLCMSIFGLNRSSLNSHPSGFALSTCDGMETGG